MKSSEIITKYLNEIKATLTQPAGAIFRRINLSKVTQDFMENHEPLISETEYRQIADTLIDAETVLIKTINN